MKRFCSLLVFCLMVISAFADPQLTAWLTNYSGQYARVYTSTARRTSGTSDITWTNQSVAAYPDIAQILYSANWVYIRYPDLPSYVMGPWLNPQGAVGSLWPSNQKNIAKFPRSPSAPNKKTSTGTGYSGNWVNGTAVFNSLDGKAWNGSALVSSPHTRYTNYWHQNAPVAEDYNFDYSLGHQNPAGVYHTHQNPLGLRYQLGDHVSFNSSTKVYSESTNTTYSHSPILGYAYDGYPIYGPYGYGTATNASSAVRRMIAGYVKRDGTTSGVDNISTNLGVIPLWSARYRTNHFFGQGETSLTTTVGTNRPSVSSTYPLGNFAEDWAYLGDVTNASTGTKYVQGTDFDLDEYNGRFCYTPDYPAGTYAYFVTIDSSGNATYPYTLGFEFYGNATGTNDTTISESVTTNFMGASDFPLKQNTPTINTSNYLITLVWSSTEGGTYTVESSTNNFNWTVQRTNVAAAIGVSSTTNYISTVSNGTAYVRLTRTALATNDSVGGATGVVGQTNIISFTLANSAPIVANAIANQNATYGAAFSFTFPTNTFTDADAGQILTYTVTSPVLTNTGIGFNASTRTFSAGTVDATNGGTITSNYIVTVIATDNGSPAKSATNTFTLTINKAAASVTPASVARTYGGTNPIFTGILSGFVAADAITASYACVATTNSSATAYSITATLNDPGARLGNYTVTTNSGTLTVNKAPLSVTANNVARTYGVTNPVFSGTLTGVTNGDNITPTYVCSATTNSGVGTYAITPALTDPGSKLGNYAVTTNSGTLTVNKAELLVTPVNVSRVYGTPNPTFSANFSGFANGQSYASSDVNGSPLLTCSATTNSGIGTYAISNVVGSLTSTNYSFTLTNGTLTVTQATLVVSANSAARVYGDVAVLTGTISGAVAGDSFSEAFSCPATTNSAPGDYSITPLLIDPNSRIGNYQVATNLGILTVTQAMLTVATDNQTRPYGASEPSFTLTYSGFKNGQTLATSDVTGSPTVAVGADVTSTPGSYPILLLSQGTLASVNYSFNLTNTGVLTISKAPLSVTAADFTRPYGVTNPVFTGSLVGVVNSDNITATYATAATAASPLGSYTITPQLADPANRLQYYTVSTTNGTLTITNASGASDYTASVTSSNALVALGLAGTNDYTFTDSASGESVTIRMIMTAYSSSNSSPSFTPLDTYGSLGQAIHLGVESYLGGGDGNFTQPFEGANFSARFLSATSGVATNTVKFGIAGIGFRFGPRVVWSSSAGSTNVSISDESMGAMDAKTVSLAGTNYTATLRSDYDGAYQWSDLVNADEKGLVLRASFFIGTNVTGSAALLAPPAYGSGQLSFNVTGTSGASYIVQASADFTNWVSVATNTAPFTFTDTGAGGYTNRFYRVVAP